MIYNLVFKNKNFSDSMAKNTSNPLNTLVAAAGPSPVKPTAVAVGPVVQQVRRGLHQPVNPPNMNHNFSIFLNKNPKVFCDYVIHLSNLYNMLGPNNAESMMNHLMQTMHLVQARHAIDRYNSYMPDDEKVPTEEVMEFVRSKKRKIDDSAEEKTPTAEENK